MKLIRVSDLTVHEFTEKNIPPYAILSHTWENGQEVSYHEMLSKERSIRKRSGYQKIVNCANEAKDHSLQWIWCDTCCIDKSSSAELSEAINSMYAYYQRADVCFAFLADVDLSADVFNSRVSLASKDSDRQIKDRLSRSKWFSRGWTLQELIAPKNLHFFSCKWAFLCDKSLIADQISTFTGIPPEVLRNGNPLTCSVAQRLSWAAMRQTTRTEDIAYCLLGILDVNMPLLYGEGEKAFVRLQEEIIRNSTDQSIFAWDFLDEMRDPLSFVAGVLADSPQNFKNCGNITESFESDDDSDIPAFTMTNLGLNISLPIKTYEHGIVCARLSCAVETKGKQKPSQIYLRKLRNGLYARIPPRSTADDHLLSAESFQLVITRRFFPPKLLYFHDAHGMNLTSGDYTSRTVFTAPRFESPQVISINTTSNMFPFQRPIPGPDHDEPWVVIVAGDGSLTTTVLLGIKPGVQSDVLWAQCVDAKLPLDSIGRVRSVEAIARPKTKIGFEQNASREDLEYGKRYEVPCDFSCCTFKLTNVPGAAKKARRELDLWAKPEIREQRLILHVHIDCNW